jgi:hypothetical protein
MKWNKQLSMINDSPKILFPCKNLGVTRLWPVWSSSSNPVMELIPTSTSRCLVQRTGGRKYDSFLGMTLTHRSPCSRVASPSPNPTRGTVWPRGTSVGYNPFVRSSSSYCEEGFRAQPSFRPFSAVGSNHSVSEE